jgi:O-antigen/teichoic acid export membrane protein
MSATINNQIAKNAMFLYLRTFFVVILMLISSRVLLKALGAEDFGLYNLVGSIVAIFTSLRVVFASATQRFLNYEKAKHDVQILSNIFVISKRLHWWLSIIFIIATEILGVWAINCYLNIPDGKFTDALIVLQCSIFSAVAMLMTVPYDAVIISNERFNAYAYLSILECFLQVTAAFGATIIPSNRLIWYSVIVLIVAIFVRFINMVYCHRTFAECRHKGYFDKLLLKDMSKFAGWNFLGNFALSIYDEGINMVLNIFGGVIANAARAISVQVLKGISFISDRMSIAFAPQATQQYAIGNSDSFHNLIFLSTKLINFVYIFIAIPIALFTPLILEIWLGETPQYSVEFIRAILIYGLARSIHSPLDLCFKCYGKLKHYQIIEICCLLPALPLAYLFLKMGLPLYWALIAMAITNFINNIAIIILAHKEWGFRAKSFITKAIMPIAFIIIAAAMLCYPILLYINNVYLQIVLVMTTISMLIFFLGLTKDERHKVVTSIKR